MTRHVLTQRERVLIALLDARGQIVSVPDLVDAMYGPGANQPASAMFGASYIVRRLRQAGHDVLFHKGLGYSLPVVNRAAHPLAPKRRNRWDGVKRVDEDRSTRMLAVLREACGAVVGHADLVDAVYPPGTRRPAIVNSVLGRVVKMLREAGHPLMAHKGEGYSLPLRKTAGDAPKVYRRDRRSPTARLAEAQGGRCAVCDTPSRRLRLCRHSPDDVPARLVCARCDDLAGLLSNPALRQQAMALLGSGQ